MQQLLAHLWGDYIFQNHWMAANKTKSTPIALVHALTYTIPFLVLTLDWRSLAIIGLTHFFIDRFRAAWWLTRIKNWSWTDSGFPEGTPPFLSVWVVILVDNSIHLTINYLALSLH